MSKIHAGVGRSLHTNEQDAASEACRQALENLPDGRADLCLVFATALYQQEELLAAIASHVGDAKIVGCTGEGIIAADTSDECSHALAVTCIASSSMRFDTFLSPGYGSDAKRAGSALGTRIQECADDKSRALIVLPDGLQGNCSDFLDALKSKLSDSIQVVGGTAGDNMAFERCYQYYGAEVHSGSAVSVLLSGDFQMQLALSHGCVPIGLERTITKASGGWVHEIDGESAWSVFKEYLDGDPQDLGAEGIVHLAVGHTVASEDPEHQIIRVPMLLSDDKSSLFFPGGGLGVGEVIRLARRDPVKIRDSARSCAEKIKRTQPGKSPALVLQFDCAGRGRILFGACAAESILAPLRETIGPETPWIGFHTFGEIAPQNGHPYYQNFTVALCALYEDVHE